SFAVHLAGVLSPPKLFNGRKLRLLTIVDHKQQAVSGDRRCSCLQGPRLRRNLGRCGTGAWSAEAHQGRQMGPNLSLVISISGLDSMVSCSTTLPPANRRTTLSLKASTVAFVRGA